MKKILFGICLSLLAVISHATTPSENQTIQSAQYSNTYLKQQIQKKRIDEKVWSKQADDFIGLKRTTKIIQTSTSSKRLKVIDHGGMLTAQNLQNSLGNI